jgi:hypothetical protein
MAESYRIIKNDNIKVEQKWKKLKNFCRVDVVAIQDVIFCLIAPSASEQQELFPD